MADTYTVLDSYKTIQVISNTQVADIQYISAASVPTGIGFLYSMAYTVWQNGPPYVVLEEIATLLEDLVNSAHVVAGQGVQDLDKNGLLADYQELVVEYDRGPQGLPPLQGTVSMAMGVFSLWATDPSIADQLGQPTPAQVCGAEYNRLKALAGG